MQANFAYPTASEIAELPQTLSIFADRADVREQLREDGLAAGFAAGLSGDFETVLDGEVAPLGDVVLVDCPDTDGGMLRGQGLAALTRLDMRVARAGGHMIVSTSMEALDTVFACLDQSCLQILVAPTRGERVIALGRALAMIPAMRLRELSNDDRLTLLRLTEQVGRIAERLEGLSETPEPANDRAFAFASPRDGYRAAEQTGHASARARRPSLPDPRLVRRMIRERQLRARFFERDLFADPAWDILLDLTAARAEHARVSVTSLCIASGVPPTTALRWISQMTEAGLLERVEDDSDRRRVFIALSDKAADAMARYFALLGQEGALA